MDSRQQKMPALFVGHGSPMNAIEDNRFTAEWVRIAGTIPRPEAILSVSAHWYTSGTRISDTDRPGMIYDMYGFPAELYKVQYKTPGAPELARRTKSLISKDVTIDNGWGLDHGTWSVLHRMYPDADIPVYQLSVDAEAPPQIHYETGIEISRLRDQGVMVFGSGNVVHNLARISWDMAGGQPWAVEFDDYIKAGVRDRKFDDVINYRRAGKSAELAFYTPDHFYPLLYVLSASREDDSLQVFNDVCMMGSMSMTCYLFQ
ncbi:MAG: 4,5-DOPA-extradiol-dioxygenase [Saccharofermentanales bacterium]